MLCNAYFTTPVTFVKMGGRKILGLYPEEKLARKMTQAKHVLKRPPGLTIDAKAYDQHLADKDDWKIIFEIDDGRRYWITVPEFNEHKKWISRGRGDQYVSQFKYLHRDGDDGIETSSYRPPAPVKPSNLESLQLSLFGGAV